MLLEPLTKAMQLASLVTDKLAGSFNFLSKALNTITGVDRLARAFEGITKAFGNLLSSLFDNKLTQAIGASITAPFVKLTTVLGTTAQAASLLSTMGGIGPIFEQIGAAVAKFNPALMTQLSLVLDDLTAVVGEILEPILKAGVVLLRQFADGLNVMVPAFAPLTDVVVRLIQLFGSLLIPYMQIFTPIIQVVGVAIGQLIPLFELMATWITKLANVYVQAIRYLINAYNDFANSTIGKKIGLQAIDIKSFDQLKEERPQSSWGKSVQQTSAMSGAELGRQARMKAMSLGGVAASPEVKATKDEVKQWLAESDEYMKNFKEMCGNIDKVTGLMDQFYFK